MTDQEINIAIAEACGWTDIICSIDGSNVPLIGITPDGNPFTKIPNYCGDLNDMLDAVQHLKHRQLQSYRNELAFICGGYLEAIDALSRQRAEAFYKVACI